MHIRLLHCVASLLHRVRTVLAYEGDPERKKAIVVRVQR